MKTVSTVFFQKNKNFAEKKIKLLKNVCNNDKYNNVQGTKLITNLSCKCQDESLKLIITDIFYFYCRNKSNGDE